MTFELVSEIGHGDDDLFLIGFNERMLSKLIEELIMFKIKILFKPDIVIPFKKNSLWLYMLIIK